MIFLIVWVMLFCLPLPVHADVPSLYYDGRPLNISVASGKITEVIFPQKVAKIVKGGGADSVLIEVMDDSVFILPKNDNPADIFVTSVKGESYPLNLIMGNTHESKVKVLYAFDPSRSSNENRGDVMDLMKLLIQGRVPAGATVLQAQEQRLLSQGKIRLTLDTVFELPTLNGLVLTAENLTDSAAIVPIQDIAYPHLLAISADADTLVERSQQGSRTRIYMVVEK